MPILAVAQPQYLPNLEFFFKMKQADVFVLADSFQYSTHSSINRARIKTANGARWLTVPVKTKGKQKQHISEVYIDSSCQWQKKHWKTLKVNYCMTPYFERHYSFFDEAFAKDWERLVNLNIHFINYFAQELLFKGRIEISSNPQVEMTVLSASSNG